MKYLLLFIALSLTSLSNLYVGLGPNFHILQNPTNQLNENNIGFELNLESRYFCNYWFGLSLEFASFDKLEDLTQADNFFESEFSLNPRFRYVFNFSDSPEYTINPYLQANLNISLIDNTDQLSDFGLGSGIGAGTTFSFDVAKRCYMLDLGFNYSGYNNIFKAEERRDFNSLKIYLILSYCL